MRDHRARRNRLTWRLYRTIMGSSLTIPVNRPVHSASLALLPYTPHEGLHGRIGPSGFNKWWITWQNLQVIAHSVLQKQFVIVVVLVLILVLGTTRCFIRHPPPDYSMFRPDYSLFLYSTEKIHQPNRNTPAPPHPTPRAAPLRPPRQGLPSSLFLVVYRLWNCHTSSEIIRIVIIVTTCNN